jgi:DNA polymerase
MRIETLSIDLETRSAVDIGKSGVYRYAEDPDFDILLFGVSVNGGPVKVYDIAGGEQIPDEILAALTDPSVTKHAFNASFERVCLSQWLRKNRPDLLKKDFLSPAGWQCSMVLAAYNGLPLSLAQVGDVLRLEDQKMSEGKALIKYFCVPTSSQAADDYYSERAHCAGLFSDLEEKRFHTPSDDPEKWETFKNYNRRDVEVEIAIQEKLKKYPVPDSVWEEYWLDQEINDRGIRIDREFVIRAIELNIMTQQKLTHQMRQLTGLVNPNSVVQLKRYLAENSIRMDSLGKKAVLAKLKELEESDDPILSPKEQVMEVLKLRLLTAKSSVKKYEAMQNAVCTDGRCRGMFQFYGANRTGRWAGRLIQLQNLPQNKLEDLADARTLTRAGDELSLENRFPSVPQVLSELIRTAFIPEPGKKYIVADFSAIEARVLAHLAGEEWRTEVFRNGGDIYCESASKMFHVPVVKHGVNGHLRQKGKVAELALGYGGSGGALKSMGALDMGLQEDELIPLVDMWRDANPNIVDYWWRIDVTAKNAIQYRMPGRVNSIKFDCRGGLMIIRLPSGRRLSYVKPCICENQYGGESIAYNGMGATKKYEKLETYGPKLVENIVQAVSRDILADAMKRLRDYRIVGHVHDELIIEADPDTDVQEICDIMGQAPDWMPTLNLRADGYECEWYRKE